MIDTANLLHRTLLMTLYSTGMRRAELTRLKVSDIDPERMVIHIRQGKGGKERLCAAAHKRSYVPRNYLDLEETPIALMATQNPPPVATSKSPT